MMSLKIVTYPAKVLSRSARRIAAGEHDLEQLFAQMSAAMREYVGVGLAAPQVGLSIRFIVVEERETGEKSPFVNPQIIEFSREKDIGPEGCLSFPGLYGDIVRSKSIKVRYEDLDFVVHEEEFSGYYARVMQHEIDHLNGVLLIDRAEDGLYELRSDEEEAEGASAACGPLDVVPTERKTP